MKKTVKIAAAYTLFLLLAATTAVVGVHWVQENSILRPADDITAIDLEGKALLNYSSSGCSNCGGAGGDTYSLILDVKEINIPGGTCTAGSYQVRDLNIIEDDKNSNIISLSSNRVKPKAGNYRYRVEAPAYQVDRHFARMYNFTNSTSIDVGTIEHTGQSASDVTTRSVVLGEFTTDGTEEFQVEHWCQVTRLTTGFGVSNIVDKSIYTSLELWREN